MNFIRIVPAWCSPPFDGLIAFDAALRHRSMTRAAGELGLTPERDQPSTEETRGLCRRAVADRTARRPVADHSGVTLAEGSAAARRDGRATRPLACVGAAAETLKIGLGSALANHWLVRRLTAFASAYPNIAIELCIIESDVQARALDLGRCGDPWNFQSGGARATSNPAPVVRRDGFSGGDPVFAAAWAAIAGAERARHFTSTAQGLAGGGRTARNGRGRCGSNDWAYGLPFGRAALRQSRYGHHGRLAGQRRRSGEVLAGSRRNRGKATLPRRVAGLGYDVQQVARRPLARRAGERQARRTVCRLGREGSGTNIASMKVRGVNVRCALTSPSAPQADLARVKMFCRWRTNAAIGDDASSSPGYTPESGHE